MHPSAEIRKGNIQRKHFLATKIAAQLERALWQLRGCRAHNLRGQLSVVCQGDDVTGRPGDPEFEKSTWVRV